jgi:hypothetical protein
MNFFIRFIYKFKQRCRLCEHYIFSIVRTDEHDESRKEIIEELEQWMEKGLRKPFPGDLNSLCFQCLYVIYDPRKGCKCTYEEMFKYGGDPCIEDFYKTHYKGLEKKNGNMRMDE